MLHRVHDVSRHATGPRLLLVAALSTLAIGAGCSGARATEARGALSPMSGKRVEARRGMVSASHPDAAGAGAEILRAGGNAVDGAVAAAFALSVVDVSQTGLGGGGALTYWDARERRAEHLSFYPRAGEDPAWARPDTGRARRPGRSAAVPGMVAGLLEAHTRFGRLPRAQVMAPAIRLAREGFIVSPLLARTIASSAEKLKADSLAALRFMPGGLALRPGDRLVQPDLAATLERVAAGGRNAFYTGAVADGLSAKVRSLGGLITPSDLASYPVSSMRPLCAEWRGFTVLGAPPPMGGASVLEMLQMSELAGVGSGAGLTEDPQSLVRLADVLRLGQADGGRWRGDPGVMQVPARGVSSLAFARQRAGLVNGPSPDTALAGDPWQYDTTAAPASCAAVDPYPAVSGARGQSSPPEPRRDEALDAESGDEGTSFTSHLAVVDADGNAVSATTTVGVLFGSGVYTGGFFLNSAGGNFDARTRGTNRYANSTMSPTLLLDRGRVRLVVGAAGSQYIQPSIVQVTLRMLAFGEDPALALAAPRIHANAGSREVEVEPGFAPAVYSALVARGYRPLSRVADISFGGVHAILVTPDGRRIGVADPRRDGAAAGH